MSEDQVHIMRLENALEELIDTAEQCDSWEYFPTEAIDRARRALDGVQ